MSKIKTQKKGKVSGKYSDMTALQYSVFYVAPIEQLTWPLFCHELSVLFERYFRFF
jgi:hypothetical protein